MLKKIPVRMGRGNRGTTLLGSRFYGLPSHANGSVCLSDWLRLYRCASGADY